MKAINWLIGGLMLGLLGSAGWAMSVYYGGWEIGAVAWAVGLLAGFGVRIAAKDNTGPAPAIVALFCAMIAVGAGKAGTIALFYYGDGGPTDEDAMVALADVVVRDWERQGRTIDWPGGWSVETAHARAHYPAQIWGEATGHWFELSYSDQRRYLRSFGHLSLLDGEYVVTYLADDVIEQKLMRGEVVGVTRGGTIAEDYSPQVWNEAVQRWGAMDDQQRRAHERFVLADIGVTEAGDLSLELFLSSILATITMWDVLWMGLAVASAWRVGYGYDAPVVNVQHQAISKVDVKPPADLSDTSGVLSRPMGAGAAAVRPGGMSDTTSMRQPLAHEIATPREADETTPIFGGDEGDGSKFSRRHAG